MCDLEVQSHRSLPKRRVHSRWNELDWTRVRQLQPINFVTLTRVTNSASCNWVNLMQVSSATCSVWRLSLRIHVFRTGLQFSSVPPLWILPKSGVSNTKTTDLKINIAELHILRWSELSRRKLSPTLATAHHYSCPDNAIGLVAQCDLSEYVKLG